MSAGPGLEARARAVRYEALEAARRRLDASAVLVAHTADDQAETVLLHLLRGSGSAGLAGMPGEREWIQRPLLGLRRADTLEICQRLALRPVHDPMNADTSFRRVWLRRELLPRLQAGAERDVVPILARQAAILREEVELLDGLADELLEKVRVAGEGGEGRLVCAPLAAAPRALARRALRRWLGPPPPSAADVERMLDVVSGRRRATELRGAVRVERSRGLLRLDARIASPSGPESVVLRVPGVVECGGWSVESWVERAAPQGWPDDRFVCVLDADRVGDEIGLRAARAGTPGLVGHDEEPVWTLDYGVADRGRVTARTRRFLWVVARPPDGVAS